VLKSSADSAEIAKSCGVFRRRVGGLKAGWFQATNSEISRVIRGGTRAARVRAGALDLPALRS